MEALDLLLAILFGYTIGKLLLTLYDRAVQHKIEQLEKEITEIENKFIKMEVEVHNDILYAFDVNTKDFVCQGKDLTALKTAFSLRFPDRNGVVVEGPKSVLEDLKRQLKESKNENSNSIRSAS